MNKQTPHSNEWGSKRCSQDFTRCQLYCSFPSFSSFVHHLLLYFLVSTLIVRVLLMMIQMQAEEAVLRHYPILIDEDGLESSILGLEFKVYELLLSSTSRPIIYKWSFPFKSCFDGYSDEIQVNKRNFCLFVWFRCATSILRKAT